MAMRYFNAVSALLVPALLLLASAAVAQECVQSCAEEWLNCVRFQRGWCVALTAQSLGEGVWRSPRLLSTMCRLDS